MKYWNQESPKTQNPRLSQVALILRSVSSEGCGRYEDCTCKSDLLRLVQEQPGLLVDDDLLATFALRAAQTT